MMLTRTYHKIILKSFVNSTLEHLENSETLRINSWPYLVLCHLVKNHLPDRQFVDNIGQMTGAYLCKINVCWLNVCQPNVFRPNVSRPGQTIDMPVDQVRPLTKCLLTKCLLSKCLPAECQLTKCLSTRCLLA
jgi:hypothetical protein